MRTDRLTLPIFGGSSKLFTTAKFFLGWLAAGDVWRWVQQRYDHSMIQKGDSKGGRYAAIA